MKTKNPDNTVYQALAKIQLNKNTLIYRYIKKLLTFKLNKKLSPIRNISYKLF